MAVDVELRHGRDHRVDLIGLAGQGRDQLSVVQSRNGGSQADLHEGHRIGSQFQEGGVTVVHSVANGVGEEDAVPQSLAPVVDIVDLLAGTDVAALVHGGEVADLERLGLDTLEFGREFAE